jgi:hypothetical protein
MALTSLEPQNPELMKERGEERGSREKYLPPSPRREG